MFVQFLEDIALVRKASVIPPEDKVKVRLNYCQLSVTIRLSAHIPTMWPIFVVVGQVFLEKCTLQKSITSSPKT